jgi:hypothetical protein
MEGAYKLRPFQNFSYNFFKSFRQLGQMFLPLNTVISLALSQKMQAGSYFLRIIVDSST